MKYVAEDGTPFKTESECVDYEAELTKKQNKKVVQAQFAKFITDKIAQGAGLFSVNFEKDTDKSGCYILITDVTPTADLASEIALTVFGTKVRLVTNSETGKVELAKKGYTVKNITKATNEMFTCAEDLDSIFVVIASVNGDVTFACKYGDGQAVNLEEVADIILDNYSLVQEFGLDIEECDCGCNCGENCSCSDSNDEKSKSCSCKENKDVGSKEEKERKSRVVSIDPLEFFALMHLMHYLPK